MNFICGSDSTWVNMDQVRFAEPRSRQNEKGEWTYSLYVVFDNEATLTIPTYGDAEDELWSLGPVVTASPGFEVVEYYQSGEITRNPIIAWRLTRYGPLGITPEERMGRSHSYQCILYPDGQVCEQGEATYESLEAFAKAKCAKEAAA